MGGAFYKKLGRADFSLGQTSILQQMEEVTDGFPRRWKCSAIQVPERGGTQALKLNSDLSRTSVNSCVSD